MEKTARAVVFGTGSFAEVVDFYLTHDSHYEVVAFCESPLGAPGKRFLDRPVVDFEQLERAYPPEECEVYVAVGYAGLNTVRERFVQACKDKGYRLISYVCSKATHWGDTKLGENVFVFESNTIQPFVTIGDNTVLWSGNHIGHHSVIGPHCFITSQVVISGHCRVGSHCFVGVNATIADGVTVAERNLIGAAAFVRKNTQPDEVHVGAQAVKLDKKSSEFFG